MRPIANTERLFERLKLPSFPIRVVLDTDTYNEIDDQYALAYALLQQERLSLEAIYAAPFLNNRSVSAADGMRKSLVEMRKIVNLLQSVPRPELFSGSEDFLSEASCPPVCNEAINDLITRSKRDGRLLYVVSIGAPTNVAKALLLDPSLADRIVIVWLGGHPIDSGDAREFNLYQDLAASRLLFDCGAPVIVVPCRQVAELLTTTIPELERNLSSTSSIGRYLLEIASEYIGHQPGSSRPIWDLAAVA